MGPQERAVLDRFACQYVPNGYYWLNTQTGLWGVRREPDAPGIHLGRVLPAGAAAEPVGRRMLYSPYDWVR